MNLWISTVKDAAYQLGAAGSTVSNEDIILTLTEGLPDMYLTLIVSLDSLPPDELTSNLVVMRLLNERCIKSPLKQIPHQAAMKQWLPL